MYSTQRERKEVLEKLRKIVPMANEHTPLLELLQKVIDYISELQELLNRSSVDIAGSKENLLPWRSDQRGINSYSCTYCSSNLASSTT